MSNIYSLTHAVNGCFGDKLTPDASTSFNMNFVKKII